ncbi:MAG TPA: TetR/AcrR family transcriptional regulator [Candidatus Kapabacteria bacterium]|jgi:AcrR family transcriptional regulator|nr:TetR/AcrR family transcriptional regulator [Candidatus Kapabacteria bacterium]
MENTKDKIVETARKLFGKYSYNKTSVDEIAKSAHVAKGTIYHYFRSKAELLEEVIKYEKRLLRNELKKNIDSAGSLQEKLRAFIITRCRFTKNLSNYYDAINEDYLSHHPFIKKLRKSDFDDDVETISQILEKGKNNSNFQINNVYYASLAILTAIHGLEYPLTINADIFDFESMVDELLHIILKGIEA